MYKLTGLLCVAEVHKYKLHFPYLCECINGSAVGKVGVWGENMEGNVHQRAD